MNKDYYIKYDNILLRPLLEEDIENLRIWRNDSKNNSFLKDIGVISKEKQLIWYHNYLNDKDEITFAIVESRLLNRMVGSLSIYNIKDNEAEFGHMLIGDMSAHGLGIGRKSLIMLLKFGFSVLGLNTIYGFVNKNNMPALINYISVGFQIIGDRQSKSLVGGMDFKLCIDRDRFERINVLENSVIIKCEL